MALPLQRPLIPTAIHATDQLSLVYIHRIDMGHHHPACPQHDPGSLLGRWQESPRHWRLARDHHYTDKIKAI
jgi:hypothetical protein